MWSTILISLSAFALCASAAPTTVKSGEPNNVGRSLEAHPRPRALYPNSHSSRTVVPRVAGPVDVINSVLADSWNAMGNPTFAEFDERPWWDPLRAVRRQLLIDIDNALKKHGSRLVWPGQGGMMDCGLPPNMNVLAVKYGEFTREENITIQESVHRLFRMLPYDIYRWLISINDVDKTLLGSLLQTDPRVQTWFKLLADAKAVRAQYGSPVPDEYNELNFIVGYFQNYELFVNSMSQGDKETLRSDVEALQRAWGV
ncbi:hypothetical protein FRB99_007290 [Tulasnella sp. 403]|nr:hypothetical protein FRB99_007290 [Tulasnella sp. 403]